MRRTILMSLLGTFGMFSGVWAMDDDIESRIIPQEAKFIKQAQAQQAYESLSPEVKSLVQRRFTVKNPDDMRILLDRAQAYQAQQDAARNRCVQMTVLAFVVATSLGAVDYVTESMGFQTNVARQARIALLFTLGKTVLGRGVNYFKKPHAD